MSSLSVRSERAMQPGPYYFDRIHEAMVDAWSPENPDGFILAAVAENGVSDHHILDHINSHSTSNTMPTEVLKYTDRFGRHDLRSLICGILQRTSMSGITVTPENMLLSSGASALIDSLAFMLADAGTSCLVPAPYYPMIDLDCYNRNDVRTRPFYFPASPRDDAAALDAAQRAAEAERCPPRMMLVANPDNPTGVIYSDERIMGLMRWCLKKKIHLVVDEVFGLSVFPTTVGASGRFRSAIEIASDLADTLPPQQAEKLWEYVHVIYALSKDFCMSGFRVGVLYTYNATLLQAYGGVAHFAMVSTVTQWHLVGLLQDTAAVDAYITANCDALEATSAIITEGLTGMNVKFVQPQGGFFVWMDLSERLGIDSWERERAIWNAIFDTAKIMLVPGETCHAENPGRYRICCCAHPDEAAHDFVARLKHFIDNYNVKTERQNWNTQGFMLAAGFGSR